MRVLVTGDGRSGIGTLLARRLEKVCAVQGTDMLSRPAKSSQPTQPGLECAPRSEPELRTDTYTARRKAAARARRLVRKGY